MVLERQTYSIDEVAQLLGMHRVTIFEKVKKGQLPSFRIGRRIHLPRAVIDRMLRGEEVQEEKE